MFLNDFLYIILMCSLGVSECDFIAGQVLVSSKFCLFVFSNEKCVGFCGFSVSNADSIVL